MGGTVVCDVTDAPEGGGAAEFAGALAGRLGLRLVLAFVVGARDALADAERTAESIARAAGECAETRVVVGGRAEALARVAAEEGADLVVVGARPAGLGGRHLRCASVRELEAATPVPVLVAPPATRRRSPRRLSPPADALRR